MNPYLKKKKLSDPYYVLLPLFLLVFLNACSKKSVPIENAPEPIISETEEVQYKESQVIIAPPPPVVIEQDAQSMPSPEPYIGAPAPSNSQDIATVEVFYGTDRARTGQTAFEAFYGPERNGDGTENPMEYGVCQVTIPPNHKVGQIESPSWWRFEFSANPKKHIILADIAPNSQTAFFQKMQTTVKATSRKEAFVFIHGYNVTFEAAARRTAQIAFDLGFDGAPIMYSWPSRGELSGYTRDESNIKWTEPHLEGFLQDIAEKSGAETIHLIAHSMGNRALTRAFARLSEQQEHQLSQNLKM